MPTLPNPGRGNIPQSPPPVQQQGQQYYPQQQPSYQQQMPPSAPKKKMSANAKGCLTAAIIVVALVIIVGLTQQDWNKTSSLSPIPTATQTSTVTPKEPEKPAIEILSDTLKAPQSGYRHIVGEVKNNGKTSKDHVKVMVTIYDKDDKVIDTNFTYTDEVPVGETRPFDIGFKNLDQLDHYKLQIGD